MEGTSNIFAFCYGTDNFHYTIKKDNSESKFDTLLREKWNNAEENGILRYKLNIKEWKILEGPYRFLAQVNLDRAANRRTPEHISSMSQPFDGDRFNFTKLPAKEIFFDIGDGTGNDVIAANVSPIEWGHSLFLPERFKCHPQRITETSLQKALELLLLSNSPYFRVIFNSLCANASVNHLHWHLYYLKHQMLLEHIELQELDGPLFELRDFPAKGFCLKLSWFHDHDIRKLGCWAFVVINHLQENNVAHNVMMTRARADSNVQIYDDIRVYIWPRESSIGVKDTREFVVAVCELFGHLSVRTEEAYRNLSAERVTELLVNVTSGAYASIQEGVRKAIVDIN